MFRYRRGRPFGFGPSGGKAGFRFHPGRGPGRPWGGRRFGPFGGPHPERRFGRDFPNAPEMKELMQEVRQLGRLVFREASRGSLRDPDKVRRLRAVVTQARQEIESIFADDVAHV